MILQIKVKFYHLKLDNVQVYFVTKCDLNEFKNGGKIEDSESFIKIYNGIMNVMDVDQIRLFPIINYKPHQNDHNDEYDKLMKLLFSNILSNVKTSEPKKTKKKLFEYYEKEDLCELSYDSS
jgi:hypothetical protein